MRAVDQKHNYQLEWPYAMLHCSKIYLLVLCLNLCSILTHYAQIMPNYLCLSSHAPGADPGGVALGAEAPPFIFRLYLINMLSIIMKFCLSIII